MENSFTYGKSLRQDTHLILLAKYDMSLFLTPCSFICMLQFDMSGLNVGIFLVYSVYSLT